MPAFTSRFDSANPNPILTEYRIENGNGNDGSAYETHEWLFQLARHWALWQSSRIGTFPLDYRDPSGPASREESEESGEDSVFWTIEDALVSLVTFDGSDGYGDLQQDAIVHATRVLSRLDDWYEFTGRGI